MSVIPMLLMFIYEFDFDFLKGNPQEEPIYNKNKNSYIAYAIKDVYTDEFGKAQFTIVKSFEGFIVCL